MKYMTRRILSAVVVATLIFFCGSLSGMSQGITNLDIPTVPSSADAPWTDSQVFWAGMTLGFVWGGVAWIFRLVRQTARQNPEI